MIDDDDEDYDDDDDNDTMMMRDDRGIAYVKNEDCTDKRREL